MGMALPSYGNHTAQFYIRVDTEPEPIVIDDCEHYGAMAPAIYLNKQIDKVAPHKKFKRGKFKRSNK